MLFRDAIARFGAKNLAGLIPNANPEKTTRRLSDTRVAGIVSAMREALRRATGLKEKAALLDVELRPYADLLVDLVREAGMKNYPSDVSLFLRSIEPRPPAQRTYKRRVTADAFAGAWRPLGEALLHREDKRWARYAGWLEHLQQVCLRNGARSPADLRDYATVKGWILAAGHRDKDAGELFTAWRKARELTGQLALSELQAPPAARHRGIQTLPNLDALLKEARPRLDERRAAAAAKQGKPAPAPVPATPAAEMNGLELLDVLMPEAAAALRHYLRHARTTAQKSPEWCDTAASAVSGFVAELYRLPPTLRPGARGEEPIAAAEDPFTLDLRHLFTEQRLTPARALLHKDSEGTGGAEDDFDTLTALGEVADVAFDQVPLIRLVVDAAARRSYAASPLRVSAAQLEDGDVPLYTPAVFNELQALWSIVAYVYGEYAQFKTKKADVWRDVERAYDAVMLRMKTHNAQRETVGFKDKRLLTLHWGQAVCIGVPTLWREAREARAVWLRKEETYALMHAKDGVIDRAARLAARRKDTPVREARQRYFKSLRQYMLAAVAFDDMMRIKNYARGAMGRNFTPILEREATPAGRAGLDGEEGAIVLDALGRPRVRGMRVTFRGFDRVAGTKNRRKVGTGAERVRSRTLSAGIVDHELLADYLFELRPEDLVRHGKLSRVEDYALADDQWAFFTQPSPVGRNATRTKRRAVRRSAARVDDCGYAAEELSKRFGKIVHWMHRDLLKLRDADDRELPTWEALRADTPEGEELRWRYRALFSGHINRQFGATYLIGVHDDYAEVMHRTNDTRGSLDTFYAEFSEAISEAKKLRGLQNPEWFKAVTTELLKGRVIDWATFDPQRPDTAQVVTHTPAPVGPPKGTRRPRPRAATAAGAATRPAAGPPLRAIG